MIPVLGLELGLPSRPDFVFPTPVAIYEDGTWSIRGLRSVIDDILPEAEQGRVVIVTAYVQEIHRAPVCPPGQPCPPALWPHVWVVDEPGVSGKRLALLVVGNEYPIPEWDEATRAVFAGAPELQLEDGHRYAFMGWFRRFSESGFAHDAGLLDLLAVAETPVHADSSWIVPIGSPHHPRVAAAEGREPSRVEFARVPASVRLETNFESQGPLVEPRDVDHALDLAAESGNLHPRYADYYYRWMIVHSPDSPTGWVRLANLYADHGHGDTGEAVLQVAIARRPDDVVLHTGLGRMYLNIQRFEAARAAYQRALELEPDRSDALFGLGMTLAELGEREQAIDVLDRFLQVVGDDVPENFRAAAMDTRARMQSAL